MIALSLCLASSCCADSGHAHIGEFSPSRRRRDEAAQLRQEGSRTDLPSGKGLEGRRHGRWYRMGRIRLGFGALAREFAASEGISHRASGWRRRHREDRRSSSENGCMSATRSEAWPHFNKVCFMRNCVNSGWSVPGPLDDCLLLAHRSLRNCELGDVGR